MGIKALLFDLDDTLLWDERSVGEAMEATCLHAAKSTGLHPASLEQAVRREARMLYESYDTFPFTQLIGINPLEALWATFQDDGDCNDRFRQLRDLAPKYRRDAWTRALASCNVDNPALGDELADYFYHERRKHPLVYEETFETLNRLRGTYQLLLLTNGSPTLQNEKLSMTPELRPYFEHIMISGNFGYGKPSPLLFQHAMKLLGIRAEEGIMIGDKLTTDIRGALDAGMTAVWVNRHHKQADPDIVPDFEIDHLSGLFPIIERIQE